MRVILNGEELEITSNNIADLLEEIDAPTRGIAVEVNNEIIPKSLHADTNLSDKDVIEIVGFIGGG